MKRYFRNKCLPSVFSIDGLNIIKQITWNVNITKHKWITYCLLIWIATFYASRVWKSSCHWVIFSALCRSGWIHWASSAQGCKCTSILKTITQLHWPLHGEIICSFNIDIFLLLSCPLHCFYRFKYFSW